MMGQVRSLVIVVLLFSILSIALFTLLPAAAANAEYRLPFEKDMDHNVSFDLFTETITGSMVFDLRVPDEIDNLTFFSDGADISPTTFRLNERDLDSVSNHGLVVSFKRSFYKNPPAGSYETHFTGLMNYSINGTDHRSLYNIELIYTKGWDVSYKIDEKESSITLDIKIVPHTNFTEIRFEIHGTPYINPNMSRYKIQNVTSTQFISFRFTRNGSKGVLSQRRIGIRIFGNVTTGEELEIYEQTRDVYYNGEKANYKLYGIAAIVIIVVIFSSIGIKPRS